MKNYTSISKTLKTHYYKLDWTVNYGETIEKVYIAIKAKISSNPNLYLDVRNCGMLWHPTPKEKIEEISKKEFIKNANGNNVARFYSNLPEYNKLLRYSDEIWNEINKYERVNSRKKVKCNNNKRDSINEILKELEKKSNNEIKRKSRVIER